MPAGRARSGTNGASSLTVPAYLAAVRAIHGLRAIEMARALRVSPSVLRRWTRGTLVPPWKRLRRMTELWGGNPELLALGAALQRYSRETGVALDEATRMIRSGQRNAPAPRRASAERDRRQLSFPTVR